MHRDCYRAGRGLGGAGVEQLTGVPSGVAGLGEQKLLEVRHGGIISIQQDHDFKMPDKYALKILI